MAASGLRKRVHDACDDSRASLVLPYPFLLRAFFTCGMRLPSLRMARTSLGKAGMG
jgi:hypothetical protein